MAVKQLNRRILMGVYHQHGSHAMVTDYLKEYGLPSIGLEITQKELEYSKLAVLKPYFGTLKSHYRNRGVEVVALDHPTAMAKLGGYAFTYAWQIAAGDTFNGNPEEARRIVELTERGILPVPPGSPQNFIRDLKEALVILKREGGDGVIRLAFEAEVERNQHMLNVIRSRDVPVAVIGVAHSDVLIHDLPSFEYIRIVPKDSAL